MRWYVEPPFADQRAFNNALLKLIDDLEERDRAARGAERPMRIAVCAPQVPFVRGGAEIMADPLVVELRARGHEADLVTVPYKWYPGTRVLDQAFLWRLLDLEEADGRPIDLVIATKWPSYCVRHPNKVVWLTHQFRQAYELRPLARLRAVRRVARGSRHVRAVERLDRVALGEARKVFAISQNVVDRLKRFTDVDATYLPPPPQKLPYRTAEPERFVLSVNRLDRAKRIDLLIEAAKLDSSLRIVITGDGPDRDRLEQLASPLNGQVEFTGRVGDERLADLYARCLAVFYAPVDEDFGMVPFEAFLSEKPVVTTTDAGGPLEIVHDRETGVVVAPDAASGRGGVRVPRRPRRRGKGLGPRRQDGRRARHLGRAASTPCSREPALVKLAYYSPMPPARTRHRRLLGPAAARAARARRGDRRRRARQAGAGGGRRRSTTSATSPTSTAGSWTRCASGRASSCCTSSSCTTSSRASPSAAATGARTSTRWSATAACRRGCSGWACSTTCCRSCGRPSRSGSRSRGRSSTCADGLIVHSRYVESRARAAGYGGRLWRIPHAAWPHDPRRARGRARATRSSAASGT